MLKVAWNDYYTISLPEGHRFPMIKYDLIPEQLLYEGTIKKENLHSPAKLAEEDIVAIHDRNYWDKLRNGNLTKDEIRRTGFPYSSELIIRERIILQGTIDCAEYALKYGVAMNVAGGTHHAFRDRGEGFCLLNDIAVAANYLLEKELAAQILVVDLDVHQGNGTASIFKNEHRVYTFSMHGEMNFPLKKETSDLDVALPDGINDESYMQELISHLPRLFEKLEPDFIFYQSGVDVLETDKLGRLALSMHGCKERDRYVLEMCKKNAVPVAISMGGGYSSRIADIVEAHANTFRLANEIYF